MLEHVVRVVAAAIAALNTAVVLSVMSGDLDRWVKPSPAQQILDQFPEKGIKQVIWLGRLAAVSHEQRGIAPEVTENAGLLEVIVPSFNRPESFDAEVALSWREETSTAGCRLVIGVGRDAFYVLTAMSNGEAVLSFINRSQLQPAEHVILSKPRLFRVRDPPSRTRLTVRVRGETLEFFVNGKSYAQVADTLLQERWTLGFFAKGHRSVNLDRLIRIH